jgi:hypothetical protein
LVFFDEILWERSGSKKLSSHHEELISIGKVEAIGEKTAQVRACLFHLADDPNAESGQ